MEDLNKNETVSTEQNIKEAARIVFLKKGFDGTKTRDIAEQSGENLALINYYFRSKSNLYRIIMNEIIDEFLEFIIPVFNNPESSIDEKIEAIVDNYITLFVKQPGMAMFVMNELSEGTDCINKNDEQMKMIHNSAFHKQLEEEYGAKGINAEHIIMNIAGMAIFPFIGRAMINDSDEISDEMFAQLMDERRQLIPIWMKSMLQGPQK